MTPRLGKLPYDSTKACLELKGYLKSPAPPPAFVNYLNDVTHWGMYWNDQCGDCTVAQIAHVVKAVSTYGLGQEESILPRNVLRAYEALTGYDPYTGANDTGCLLQDALNYWRRKGVGIHRCLAFAKVDVNNWTEIQQAISIFGSISVGFEFPQFAMDQFNAGLPWDVQSTNNQIIGGHAVDVGGYTQDGNLQLVTWGQLQEMTGAFWNRYVDEAWAVITPEWLNTQGFTPGGLDLQQLGADLAELTGTPDPFSAPAAPANDVDTELQNALNEFIHTLARYLKR